MEYKLVRSKRKTVSLVIADGVLEVRAPLSMHKSQIEQIVASKESWIQKKLVESRERKEQREDFLLAYDM